MDLDRTKTPKQRRGLTAADKAAQRERIFAKLRDGRAVYVVAREENLSAGCVRQIVKEILDGRAVEEGAPTARLEIARLVPVVLRRRPRIIAPRSNVWARCCSSILDGRNPALC